MLFGWWLFFIFTPNIGEDEPILTSICLKGVGEKPPTSYGCFLFPSEVFLFWKFLRPGSLHLLLLLYTLSPGRSEMAPENLHRSRATRLDVRLV